MLEPRPGVDDLWGVDLGKALPVHVFPEGAADGVLDPEDGARPQRAQHHRAQAQLGVQVQRQPALGDGHRQGGRRAGEHFHLRAGQLEPARRPGLFPDGAGDPYGALVGDAVQARLPGTDALHHALAGAQGEEGQRAHAPQGVDHTVEGDGLVIPADPYPFCDRGFTASGSCHEFHAVHTFPV